MRFRFRLTFATLIVITFLVGGWLTAATSPQVTATPPGAQDAPLTQQIPPDPAITLGTYSNGMKYYVKANKKPEQRAELRLVVNAGSILEDDDQRGLAHFVEHMAFNGTKHFPKQEIVNFMESIGMRFGAHLNAYTSFDETVYQLQVPLNKPDVLDKALLVLEDWAQNVSFDPAEIEKERGVVTEEWRLGLGASARIRDKQLPVILKGSRYADRLPIGKMEVVQGAKPERLTQFYADWYRPDLMGIIAVGDFDVAAVKSLLDKHFGALPKRATAKPRPSSDVPDHPGTLYTIATDKEETNTSVTVYNKLTLRDQTTVGAYRRQLVEGMFSGMLSARFAELSQKPDAPFLGAGTGRGLFVRTKEATTSGAGVKEDGAERGLQALVAETERVSRFGFTATELDREKRSMLRAIERAVAEKDKQESSSYADEYVRNFTDREPIPGIVYENALYQRFVPEITLAELNALAKDWSPDRNRVVAVSGPEKAGLVLPTEQQLAGIMASAPSMTLTAYVDTVTSDGSLLDTPPAAGSIVKTANKETFGITEWELSNGVKVVLKPTNYKADEIVVRGTSPGGTSLVSDADIIPAETATQVVAAGGLGKYNLIDLRKALAGKAASVRPFIDEVSEGISGSASPKDLETLFQLIYLTFTAPRKDPTIFGVMTMQMKALLANQQADPEFAFQETLEKALSQNHPRVVTMTAETVNKMDLEKSFAFYKDRFSDASDFTFTFVGSFDPAAIKPLAERYLASLPATHRKETWRDTGVTLPPGVVEKRVEKGVEPKSHALIVFNGPFKYEQEPRIAIRAMAQILENRLRDVLREDLGGTYSVSVSPSYDKIPREEYQLFVDFSCNPSRTDELIKMIFKEIDALKANGPTDKQLNDEKEGLLRDYEVNIKQNGYFLSQIAVRYQYGEDLTSLFKLDEYYKKVDAAMIRDAARTYLNTSRYVEVTSFPEKKTPTSASFRLDAAELWRQLFVPLTSRSRSLAVGW